MNTLWETLQAWGRCGRRMLRLGRLAGSAEALERRLAELEEEILSQRLGNKHCAHCGSDELEPVEALPSAAGVEVGKFRCKACGLMTS